MSLYLHTNISSLKSRNALNISTKTLDTSYERLSSGLRINSAKDDPAGVQTSDRLTTEIDSLSQTNRNAQNAISYAQTAEGALEEITSMLQRIRILALQSANGINTSNDRLALQQEVDELNEEICRIAEDTTFAGEDILNGTASVVRFQISPDPNSIIKIDLRVGFNTSSIAYLAAQYTGSDTFEIPAHDSLTASVYCKYTDLFSYKVNGGGIDITTASKAQMILAGVDGLLRAIDSKRAEFGAVQNRLEATIRNQDNIRENVSDSRSQIRDTDWADEVSKMTAAQILQQGSVSILIQANSRPEIALQILQS